MGLTAIAGGVSIATTVFNLAGNNASAQASRDAARAQAILNEAKADERLRQVKRESNIFKRQADVALGDITSSYAKAGVELSGSPLLVLANSARELESERAELVRKGNAEVRLLRLGAANARAAADKVSGNLVIEQIGAVLGGAAGFIKTQR